MSIMQDSHSISQVVAGMAVAGYTVVPLLKDHHHLSLEATTPRHKNACFIGAPPPLPRGKTTAFENHGHFWSTIGYMASQEGDYQSVLLSGIAISVRYFYQPLAD